MCKVTKNILIAFIIIMTVLTTSCCMETITAANKLMDNNAADTNKINLLSETDEKIVIAEGKDVKYSIITAEDAPDDVKLSVEALISTIKNNSGNGAVNVGSSRPGESSYDSSTKEILIGNTGYSESDAVFDELAYGDYCVTVNGNKLIVAGYSRDALNTAITKLITTIKSNAKDGIIAIPAGLKLEGTSDKIINNLPKYTWGNRTKTVYESSDTSIAIITGTKLSEYDVYLSMLEALGYKYHTSNTIGSNQFATYYNDSFVINASFIPFESAVRITIEKKVALIGLEKENIYTANSAVTTSLGQMGLAVQPNVPNNGMAYVIQLADGSFIVIDGGFTNDAARLYKYLKAQAPNGEIVIAAWFLTHNDGDHRQCFVEFAPKYTDVKIEQVIFNYPASAHYLDCNSNENTGTVVSLMGLENCKVIKAHTGYKFFIRNAEIEILYSIDNLFPSPLKIFNNSSLVLSVKLDNKKITFLGDISDDAAEILTSMYGNLLKCDILQLAHHGLRNGYGTNMPKTEALYAIMRPAVVLWPVSEEHYLNVNGDTVAYQVAVHKWNKVAVDSAREVYIAGGDYMTVLDFPYSIFSAYKLWFADI